MNIDNTNQELAVDGIVVPLRHVPKNEVGNVMELEDTPFTRRIRPLLVILGFSVWGNLTRVSMEKLITYANAYVYYKHGTIIWVNFTSCFVMGWADSCVKLWSYLDQGSKVKHNYKQLPLHAGITAGYCGCVSTLSALLIELFYKTTNNTTLKVPNHGYGVMEFFAIVLGQLGLCFFAMNLGKDFGLFLDAKLAPILKPYLNQRLRFIIEDFIIIVGLCFFIANLIVSIALPLDNWYKNEYSLTLLLGLPATFLRFQLTYFNGKLHWKWFPLGTFLANAGASLLLAIIQVLLNGYKKGTHDLLITNETQIWVLNAFANGFGGSLSTLAAMCREIQLLEVIQHRYYYFFITFCICWSLVILIPGSYLWSVGLRPV